MWALGMHLQWHQTRNSSKLNRKTWLYTKYDSNRLSHMSFTSFWMYLAISKQRVLRKDHSSHNHGLVDKTMPLLRESILSILPANIPLSTKPWLYGRVFRVAPGFHWSSPPKRHQPKEDPNSTLYSKSSAATDLRKEQDFCDDCLIVFWTKTPENSNTGVSAVDRMVETNPNTSNFRMVTREPLSHYSILGYPKRNSGTPWRMCSILLWT